MRGAGVGGTPARGGGGGGRGRLDAARGGGGGTARAERGGAGGTACTCPGCRAVGVPELGDGPGEPYVGEL